MTGAGMVLGTPEYMAPELIMGEPFDGRVDQYALAITVYELLCGRRPFEDETKTKVLVLHTSKPPSPLTAWCPALPVRLSQAVLKGLAKEPADRYTSCVELANAVAAAAETSVAHDERIRLKCSACGKTGSIPVADLARLKAGGGRATCPACKSPIDIGNAVHVAPGPTTGGTMKFSVPASSGQFGLASGQGGTGTTGFVSPGGSASSGGLAPTATPPPARRHNGPLRLRSPSATPFARQSQPSAARRLGNPHRTRFTAIRRCSNRRFQEPDLLRARTPRNADPGKGRRGGAIRDRHSSLDLGRPRARCATTLLLVIAFLVSRFGTAEETKSNVSQLAPKSSAVLSPGQAPVQPERKSPDSALPRLPSPAAPAADATNLAKAAELATGPGVPPGTDAHEPADAPLTGRGKAQNPTPPPAMPWRRRS